MGRHAPFVGNTRVIPLSTPSNRSGTVSVGTVEINSRLFCFHSTGILGPMILSPEL